MRGLGLDRAEGLAVFLAIVLGGAVVCVLSFFGTAPHCTARPPLSFSLIIVHTHITRVCTHTTTTTTIITTIIITTTTTIITTIIITFIITTTTTMQGSGPGLSLHVQAQPQLLPDCMRKLLQVI